MTCRNFARVKKRITYTRYWSVVSLIFLLISFAPVSITAQQAKQIHHQEQLWISLNNTIKFSEKWGMIADFHMRSSIFVNDPNFYFVRFGANYWINKQVSTAAGYGHMWLANPVGDSFVYSNENRIYEQLQYSGKMKNTGLLLRFRNEQRWQQKLKNGAKTDETRFTNRVRYLTNVNFQVFKNAKLPRLMVADEICIQFCKEVIYNTFDQNRLSLGIQQKLSKTFSMDLAYMLVYQQKYSGYQYDLNNTLRLFFYWTPDFSKSAKPEAHHPHLSGDE